MRIGREAVACCRAATRSAVWAWAMLALLGVSLPTSAEHAAAPAKVAAADTVVVVVRHAEKLVATVQAGSVKPDEDPPLTPAGEARAAALSDALADADVKAIYSTPFRRTRQTAAPLAARSGIEITSYDPHTAAPELAQRILREHRGRTVLVVGHSNTVPDIVTAFSGTKVEAIEDATYGRLFVVTISPAGEARLLRLGFPPAPPEASP